MKKRNRSVLGILLVLSMVISMNTAALGGVNSVESSSGQMRLMLTTDPDAEGYDEDYAKQGRNDALNMPAEISGYTNGREDGYDDGYNDGYFDGDNYGYGEPDPDNYDYQYKEMVTSFDLDRETALILIDMQNRIIEGDEEVKEQYESYLRGFIDTYNEEYKRGFDEAYLEGYARGLIEGSDRGYILPTSGTQTVLYDQSLLFPRNDKGDYLTKVEYTDDSVKITGLSIDNILNLKKTEKGKSVIETMIAGEKQWTDKNLVNKKNITVSFNNKAFGIEGLKYYYDTDTFYDVLELEDGNYLFLEYFLYGGRLRWVEGVDELLPIARYTGQKMDFFKPNAKDSKGKAYDLVIRAALVKYADNTLEKIPGLSITGARVDKNGKDASVSGESIDVKGTKVYNGIEYKDSEYKEYKKAGNAGDLASFTIKAKAKGAAKSSAKAIKKALKDQKYRFGIAQKCVIVGIPHGSEFNNGKFENTSELTLDIADDYDNEELAFNFSEGYSGIAVSKYNGKKANVTSSYTIAGGKTVTVKLKEGKDYVLEKGKLGEEDTEVAVLKEFKGNYCYSYRNGIYEYGYRLAFRQNTENKNYLRGGVFKADGDGYVYSTK